jgi:hypothetical protein
MLVGRTILLNSQMPPTGQALLGAQLNASIISQIEAQREKRGRITT